MKTCGGLDVYLHTFITSVLDECKWLASHSARFIPGEGNSWTVRRREESLTSAGNRTSDFSGPAGVLVNRLSYPGCRK
jgi:hypothetical protein